MKASLTCFMVFFGSVLSAIACDVCQRNQPKLLQNISHGTGPQAQSDYYIIAGAAILVLLTLFYSLKYLLRPGEQDPGHIKNLILNHPPQL